MDLKCFDNQCAKVTTVDGEVYEGIVTYQSREYVLHEYGIDEEALCMVPVLFCESEIAAVESLETVDGPFGHYSGTYGHLEQKSLEWGTDVIEEIFETDDDTGILRMLACMKDQFPVLMKNARPGMAPWRTRSSLQAEEDGETEDGPVYLGELEHMLKTLILRSSGDVQRNAEEMLTRICQSASLE